MIKSVSLIVLTWWVLAITGFAGTTSYSGNEMKEAVAQSTPCPEWYADTEWNVSLWGTYAFAGNNGHADIDNSFNINRRFAELNLSQLQSNDAYLQTDHAWGGGGDLKFFFHRYFGVGVEGFLLDAKRNTSEAALGNVFAPMPITLTHGEDRRVISSVLGTFTIRYPIHCSRWSPYVWTAAGAIFNGHKRDILLLQNSNLPLAVFTEHHGAQSEALGQFGGGLEFRFTRHIGWMNDFSWNVLHGPNNNFGMIRSGFTFAF